MKRIALAAVVAAFVATPAQAVVRPEKPRPQHASPFVAAHVNALLRHKCRPTYDTTAGNLALWIHRHQLAHRAKRGNCRAGAASSRSPWYSATATWYGPCCYGHGHKCPGGGVLTESSWWVASMTLPCGTRVTLCDGSRCATAPVEDTGAFAVGNFDLTPAVARALGGLYTHSVRWRRG